MSEPCEGQCRHYLNKHRPFFQKKSDWHHCPPRRYSFSSSSPWLWSHILWPSFLLDPVSELALDRGPSRLDLNRRVQRPLRQNRSQVTSLFPPRLFRAPQLTTWIRTS